MKVICFDLEGPISPQDNAYDVMGLVENGHQIFEVLSGYDDILTLEGRKDYEPGDTLKLIAPFLLYHKITESDIRKVSEAALIVGGVNEVISKLKAGGWDVYIISTSYQQHAFNVGKKVGVSEKNIFCTKLPLDSFSERVTGSDLAVLKDIEDKILDTEDTTGFLDDFYYGKIPEMPLGEIMDEIRVIGGARKVDALMRVSDMTQTALKDIVVVGDSITDFKMLERVRDASGLSVVFNGNEYAIPYGNVGIADDNMGPLLKIIDVHSSGGLDAVKVLSNENDSLQWLVDLTDEELEKTIELHKKYRKIVRGAAAKLG